jgi:hypothetical protein
MAKVWSNHHTSFGILQTGRRQVLSEEPDTVIYIPGLEIQRRKEEGNEF